MVIFNIEKVTFKVENAAEAAAAAITNLNTAYKIAVELNDTL